MTGLALALSGWLGVSGPVPGQAMGTDAHSLVRPASIQYSAQTKKVKAKTRAARRPQTTPPTSAFGGWRPADPSFDQNGRPYQPPPGLSCPVDLGYGRWASCNDDF